ncbi:hypothetical protein R3P38DRAFT_3231536 [Favolaschia claudopus]|uniref:Reverse transcriptase n=1 Tax=Favolaschia claudopus TaxID=2862362 RepID=A0AAV9ZK74_9AGAR
MNQTATYLGFVLDHKLNWKAHVERAVAKGTAAVLAVMRLTRPTVGMPHCYVRRLYISVVLPKMEYGLVAWYQPIRGEGRKKGSTAATDAMEYHAFVAPVKLRLNRTAMKNALRLASLPKSHPLNPLVSRCARLYVQRHRSPLHELYNAFPNASDVETIDSTPTRLTWAPRFS